MAAEVLPALFLENIGFDFLNSIGAPPLDGEPDTGNLSASDIFLNSIVIVVLNYFIIISIIFLYSPLTCKNKLIVIYKSL